MEASELEEFVSAAHANNIQAMQERKEVGRIIPNLVVCDTSEVRELVRTTCDGQTEEAKNGESEWSHAPSFPSKRTISSM